MLYSFACDLPLAEKDCIRTNRNGAEPRIFFELPKEERKGCATGCALFRAVEPVNRDGEADEWLATFTVIPPH